MLDIPIALFASATAFDNRMLNRVRSRLAGSSNIVLTIVGHGTGITVANLFCVTATRKQLMYARGLAKTAKEKFVRIVRARVLKNTMIELYGERFRIAGEKQVYPVRQMPLAIDEVYLLKGVETIVAAGNAGASARIDFEKAAESLVGFWDLLLEKLPVNYPKLTVQLKLGSLKHPKDILAATSESEFPAIVYKIAEAEIQVMEQASGLRNMSDTKILGGNTFGGSLVFTFNKVLNDPKSKACFIDTTPAGLHEVKTKVW